MITVAELMKLPLFAGFNLITSEDSTANEVTGTGIFDWETPEIIRSTFETGEFVIAILDKIEEDRLKYIECIRLIIEKGASAVAFKVIGKSEVPIEILDYAELYHVPIYTFSNTYFDDIIYAIKSRIVTENLNGVLLTRVRKLISTSKKERQQSLIQRINPVFRDLCFCTCVSTRDAKEFGAIEKILEITFPSYMTVIRGERCLLIIETFAKDERETLDLEKLIPKGIEYVAGFSGVMEKKDLAKAIVRSETALFNCLAGNIDKCNYMECGILRMLYPVRKNAIVRDWYNQIDTKLRNYDREHETNLKETLIAYVQNDFVISEVASVMYQHSNTIRYRISRIMEIIGFEEDGDRVAELSLYVWLDRIYEITKDGDII